MEDWAKMGANHASMDSTLRASTFFDGGGGTAGLTAGEFFRKYPANLGPEVGDLSTHSE